MKCRTIALLALMGIFAGTLAPGQQVPDQIRARDVGILPGEMPAGKWNAITDVPGVEVGHTTLKDGDSVRTGVTAILPHRGNLFQNKVPAAISVGNGFGKLAGVTQVRELGNIETPILLTNTLSVGTAVEAVVKYTLEQPGNEEVRSVNAVVGETNDGYLNDIRGMHVTREDVIMAIANAKGGSVMEGSVGAGTGTRCLGFKGGIGTSSRVVQFSNDTQYTVGVLVQTNYGGDLRILGVPVGARLSGEEQSSEQRGGEEGSCMIVVATDAPLSSRNLERMAGRTFLGLGRTGSVMSNGSGDYAIAFTTGYRIASGESHVQTPPLLANSRMTPLFQAVVEATEEAVYNSLFMATTTRGYQGRVVNALPVEKSLEILEGVKDDSR